MVTIASHCLNNPAREHTLQCAWPEQAYVQWGGAGLVFNQENTEARTTAFFEAFTKDNAASFIRGEGTTIAEAELSAHNKWLRQVDCRHVHWQRRGYTNGLAFCAKCGAGKSVMHSIVKLGHMRKPISPSEEWILDDWSEADGERADDPYRNQLRLRRKLFGVAPLGQAKGMDGLLERIVSGVVSRETSGGTNGHEG